MPKENSSKFGSHAKASSEAHMNAQSKHRERMSKKEKTIKDNIAAAAKRTPQQQVARLDKMFGKGKGAAKERAKLELKITGGTK